jgi:hypothetical protein
MKINYRTYCGLAGDLQELLIAEIENNKLSVLYTRSGIFKKFNYWLAKKKLTNILNKYGY